MPIVEILSQGDEVICGQIVDSNSAWLAERLTLLGFEVRRHCAVGDRLDDIAELLREVSSRCDLCISTGGLGPTEDDLTAAAAAQAFDAPLAFDPKAMADIEAIYRRFGKPMPETNRKQAWLPSDAQRLDNRWGTAPGFAIAGARAWLVFLPGVPREMRKLFDRVVVPQLRARFALSPGRLITLRTVGIGESSLQARLQGFDARPATLGFRTTAPENQVKLRLSGEVPEATQRALVAELRERIGLPVYSVEGMEGEPGGGLMTVVERLVGAAGISVASGEWGSGGQLAACCSGSACSDSWYRGGRVAGALSATGLEPVSADYAEELASRARRDFGADVGLGLSLFVGPDAVEGRPKPGTAHLVLEGDGMLEIRQLHLGGGPELLRKFATAAALDLLRRRLLTT